MSGVALREPSTDMTGCSSGRTDAGCPPAGWSPRIQLVLRSFATGRVLGLVTADRGGTWHWWLPDHADRRPRRWWWLVRRRDRRLTFTRHAEAASLGRVLVHLVR